MKLALFKGVKEEDKAEVRANFISAALFRKHLVDVIEREIKSVYNEMEDEDYYECPNYALKQSGRVQRVKTLKQIAGWCKNEEK